MRPGLVEDLKSEGRLTGRVVVVLSIFYGLQALWPTPSGVWVAALFVAQLVAAIALQWAVVALVVIRPTLTLGWYYRDGKAINSNHVTLEWSTTEPAKFYELQIRYRESGIIARHVGAWLCAKYDETRVEFSPAMATIIVEDGRGLISETGDGTGFLIPTPRSQPEFFANPIISINPKEGKAPTTVVVRSQPSGTGVGRFVARIVYFRTSVKTIELVFDDGGP